MQVNANNQIRNYAATTIRCKARQLVGNAGISNDDIEDIEQELWVALLKRMPHYNAAKAKHTTFVARIIDHKIIDLLLSRTAGSRDYRRVQCSLNEEFDVEDGEALQAYEIIDADVSKMRAGISVRTDRDHAELKCDLACTMSQLPKKLQTIAEVLKHKSPTEAARFLCLSRCTIYAAIHQIRRHFKKAGLEKYL